MNETCRPIIRCEKDEEIEELKAALEAARENVKIHRERIASLESTHGEIRRSYEQQKWIIMDLQGKLDCASHKCNENYYKNNICVRFTTDCLEISVRAANVIQNENLHDLNDLCRYSPSRFLEIPMCGEKTVMEIMECLHEHKMRLAIRSEFDLRMYRKFYNKEKYDAIR